MARFGLTLAIAIVLIVSFQEGMKFELNRLFSSVIKFE